MRPANENIARIIEPELPKAALIPHESAVCKSKLHEDIIIKDFSVRRPLQWGTASKTKLCGTE